MSYITEDKVINFIDKFKEKHPEEITDAFLSGLCYYFAKIIQERFGGILVFDEEQVHFAIHLRIDSKDYICDINGLSEISQQELNKWWPWDEYKKSNPEESKGIEKSCILKEK